MQHEHRYNKRGFRLLGSTWAQVRKKWARVVIRPKATFSKISWTLNYTSEQTTECNYVHPVVSLLCLNTLKGLTNNQFQQIKINNYTPWHEMNYIDIYKYCLRLATDFSIKEDQLQDNNEFPKKCRSWIIINRLSCFELLRHFRNFSDWYATTHSLHT